jgi:hypothetical protein
MKNPGIQVSFGKSILAVRFMPGTVIATSDLIKIYTYANERANGKPYCALFEAAGQYELTEDAVQ